MIRQIRFYFILLSILSVLYSCHTSIEISKRKYNKGFFIEVSNSVKNNLIRIKPKDTFDFKRSVTASNSSKVYSEKKINNSDSYNPENNERPVLSSGVSKDKHEKKKGSGNIIQQNIEKFTGSRILHSGQSVKAEKKQPNTVATILIILGVLLIIGFILLIVAINDTRSAVNNSTKKGCFIATACYGDYDAPEVHVLRKYRDEKLLKTISGRLFVKFYYALSPALASSISKSEGTKKIIRNYFLEPLVARLSKKHQSFDVN